MHSFILDLFAFLLFLMSFGISAALGVYVCDNQGYSPLAKGIWIIICLGACMFVMGQLGVADFYLRS